MNKIRAILAPYIVSTLDIFVPRFDHTAITYNRITKHYQSPFLFWFLRTHMKMIRPFRNHITVIANINRTKKKDAAQKHTR